MLMGERVILAPLMEADSATLFSWINDREQVILNSSFRPIHEGSHRDWYERVQRTGDIVVFAIRARETNKLIGTCQLHSIQSVHRCAELQIRIGRIGDRGKGCGTEATRLLVDFAFTDLNLHRVQLHVRADNVAAIRVYEKAGFTREGLMKEAAYIDGRYVDLFIMAVLRGKHADA